MYKSTLKDFLQQDAHAILGVLADSFNGVAQTTTITAWLGEIELLQVALKSWGEEDSYIFFEYDIPRLGKRIDVALLIKGIVFCLEFKVGQKEALQADLEQAFDYALDLKNFHLFSSDRPIAPILIPTACSRRAWKTDIESCKDGILKPMIVSGEGLPSLLERVINKFQDSYDHDKWGMKWLISPYQPTPTIIEAARALYENHSVENITKHEADKESTDATISYVLDVIDQCKKNHQKAICFVTGVPGAGKTLVGLDVAVKQSYRTGKLVKGDGAVYLSGNGPLVAVLSEALAQDNKKKSDAKNEGKTLSAIREEVKSFIQIIHRYRDNMLAKIKNPVENGVLEIDKEKAISREDFGYGEWEPVAIFDEAQRSWTHKRLADYLKRGGTYGNKLKVPNFPVSEAAFLIWSLDLRKDWAVIVCLVGGGQEINTGEAGIIEWLNALNNLYRHWHIHISDALIDPEYAGGNVNEILKDNPLVTYSSKLHLSVNQRSFRAERLSDFVQALLRFDIKAKDLNKDVVEHGYPVFLTRDINKARTWLRSNARGTSQTGVLVSKVAARFKPQAINVLAQGDDAAVHWFLEDKNDVRSSNYLEEAATEIQVQGLELDYACVLWDADMRYNSGRWEYYKFNGRSAWSQEKNEEQRKYMLNAYRVLMTRARQGLVICVPEGNPRQNAEGFPEDPTRLPEFYDSTYEYLKSLGLKEL